MLLFHVWGRTFVRSTTETVVEGKVIRQRFTVQKSSIEGQEGIVKGTCEIDQNV